MDLEDCLPHELKESNATITKIAAGMSGAGVYRVELPGQSYVLKVAAETENADDWHRALHIQKLAAAAGLAPRVVHVDDAQCSVLTEFVADRSFFTFWMAPQTREAALDLLGRTVRRIHALPLPEGARMRPPREFLGEARDGLLANFALPSFADEAIRRVRDVEPPDSERPLVMSHNDLNPTNLIYNGESILLLDWATAGPMDPFYDLAVLAVFLRMDAATSLRMLTAYDEKPHTELPMRFIYDRCLAATLAGTMQLYIARQLNHPGATGTETLEATPTLGEFYQQMRSGTFTIGTPEGQWAFGLSLIKEGLSV